MSMEMEIEEVEVTVVTSVGAYGNMTADTRRILCKFDSLSLMRPNILGRKKMPNLEENLAAAERLISKWDTNTTSNRLFYSSPEEVCMYMDTVDNLQLVMENLSGGGSSSVELIRGQWLMKISMARLRKEFYEILLSNSEPVDLNHWSSTRPAFHFNTEDSITGSTSDDDGGSNHSNFYRPSSDTICEYDMVPLDVVLDLRNIAQRMAKSGYGWECVRVFALARKSIVEESLCTLGVEKLRFRDVRKMEWKLLDEKIKKWIYPTKFIIRILFAGEKRLCDEVFEGLNQMKGSCFAEIAKKPTVRLLAFADAVAASSRAPEKIFRILDLYDTLAELMPDIEDLDLGRGVQEQADGVLVRLGEVTGGILTEFDKTLEKDNSKVPIAGGTIHPLTRYVMNYLTFLSDYMETLIKLAADTPVELPKALPDDFAVDDEVDDPSAPLSIRFGWTIFLLLCKLDTKSNLYKDVAMSYLFLMNNLHYIGQKVKGSGLKFVLGEEWLKKHWNKVRQYAANYEKAAWTKVLSSLTYEGVHVRNSFSGSGGISQHEALLDRLKGFNLAMEEVMRRHRRWVVPDVSLRKKVGLSIAEKLIPAYCSFLARFRHRFDSNIYIKYTPEGLQDFTLDMFKGSPSSVSSKCWGNVFINR